LYYLAMSLPMAHFARRLERKLQRRDAVEAVESEVH
jgi:ABC-type amino acid transport system permease subunit